MKCLSCSIRVGANSGLVSGVDFSTDRSGVHLYTVTELEWDSRKATSNVRKHGIQFADVAAVLEDDRAITVRDDAYGEERWVTIGIDALARILTVVYTWRNNAVRIISARRATMNEHRQYLEQA